MLLRSDLLGLRYEPLYESTGWPGVDPLHFVDGHTQRPASIDALPHRCVIASDEVTTDEATGVLHVAPAFGEADYAMGRAEGLMFLQPVRSDGTLIGGPGDDLLSPGTGDDMVDGGAGSDTVHCAFHGLGTGLYPLG